MAYNVYKVSYLGVPINHLAIFVETNSDRSGYIYQVVGDIQNGMSYGHKSAKKPEESVTFLEKVYIGTVSTTNYPRIESIVNGVEPPKKQFNGPERINPQEPLRRCGKWTAEAVQALENANVIEP